MDYYDRQGNRLSLMEWAALFERTDSVDLRRVAETTLPDGKWISTVHLGVDHRFAGGGPPLIFETMVFPSKDDLSELACERYSTEAEALAGHAVLVAKWTSVPIPEPEA